MNVYKASRWKLVDLTWNAVIHQDSKTRPKCETIWVILLSDPCAVSRATNSFIYELLKMQLSVQNSLYCKVGHEISKVHASQVTEGQK